jgi:uncharacterized protein (TIGR00369 family)
MEKPSDERNSGGYLNELLGVEWVELGTGFARARMAVTSRHMAPNGYLHAASVIALADSACGFGCTRSLPAGASSFTTIELKSNFLGTAGIGQAIACHARLVHGGRTTQIWDAEVVNETTGKPVALFRCTQLVLYPKA